ncbi:hypothetical protein DVH24_020674 [Malus domestica]|uniref:FBD domain-containing protein n=1 Tax=Malus domestica TaxID=3750 RepID=A0A498JE54_MALDO|nr:hypothetical protein DVH24_020674 [Malus domestica]
MDRFRADLTRLGTVSKSCRRLHLSTPTIRVYRCFVVHNFVDPHLSNFLSSFDRFLIQRGNSKIHIFSLRLCRVFSANATARGFDEELYQIFSWIYNVVRCNVEVLEFELVEAGYIIDYEGALLESPSCVFSCRSLRSLRLSLRYGIIKSPLSSPSSNNIVFLRLNFVTLEECFCKWISCCCKCIKDIWLECVKGIESITIESSSLELFEVSGVGLLYLKVFGEKLEHISIDWSHNSPNVRLFVMSAPNLKYLSWIGNVMNNNLNFGELLRLEKVKLSHRFGVYDLDSAFKFIYSIRRVKFLILDEATMKVLFRGLVPGPLHDVTFLRIEFEELIEDDIIPTLSSLFSKSYWELQNLFLNLSRLLWILLTSRMGLS